MTNRRKQFIVITGKEAKKLETYRGKPTTEMTKEELIEALRVMGEFYANQIKAHIKETGFLCGLGTE